jgi:hypothetical protein
MSGKQKEEASRNLRGNLINKISPVIDGLPSKFTASELYGAAGIVAKSPYRRMLVASVLRSAFKCEQVNGFWRKP